MKSLKIDKSCTQILFRDSNEKKKLEVQCDTKSYLVIEQFLVNSSHSVLPTKKSGLNFQELCKT